MSTQDTYMTSTQICLQAHMPFALLITGCPVHFTHAYFPTLILDAHMFIQHTHTHTQGGATP